MLLRVCCAVVLVASSALGTAEEMSGEQFAHSIIVGDEHSEGIPNSAVDEFLSSIRTIETSRFARVSFMQMSNWRKRKFEEAVQQWIRLFPEEDYRVDVIIKAHAAQTLIHIAQLFTVVPLRLEDGQRSAANKQLGEIQIVIESTIKAEWDDAAKRLRDQYPFLGEDSTFDFNNNDFLSHTVDEDDDLNPFRCYPLKERVYEDVKRSIEKILESVSIPAPDIDANSLQHVEAAKQQGTEEEMREILHDIRSRVHRQTQFYLQTEIFDKIIAVLDKNYSDAVPQHVKKNYRSYAGEISTLVDSEIIKKAHDVQWKITQEKNQKWVEDHNKEFDMLIASMPKEPAYDIPEPSISMAKVVVLVVTNVLLIAILIILYLRHRKHGTKT